MSFADFLSKNTTKPTQQAEATPGFFDAPVTKKAASSVWDFLKTPRQSASKVVNGLGGAILDSKFMNDTLDNGFWKTTGDRLGKAPVSFGKWLMKDDDSAVNQMVDQWGNAKTPGDHVDAIVAPPVKKAWEYIGGPIVGGVMSIGRTAQQGIADASGGFLPDAQVPEWEKEALHYDGKPFQESYLKYAGDFAEGQESGGLEKGALMTLAGVGGFVVETPIGAPAKGPLKKLIRGWVTKAASRQEIEAGIRGLNLGIRDDVVRELADSVEIHLESGFSKAKTSNGLERLIRGVAENEAKRAPSAGGFQSVVQVVNTRTGAKTFYEVSPEDLRILSEDLIDGTSRGVAGKQIGDNIYHLTAKTPTQMVESAGFKNGGKKELDEILDLIKPPAKRVPIRDRVTGRFLGSFIDDDAAYKLAAKDIKAENDLAEQVRQFKDVDQFAEAVTSISDRMRQFGGGDAKVLRSQVSRIEERLYKAITKYADSDGVQVLKRNGVPEEKILVDFYNRVTDSKYRKIRLSDLAYDKSFEEVSSTLYKIFGKRVPIRDIPASRRGGADVVGKTYMERNGDTVIGLLRQGENLDQIVANHEGWHWYRRNLSDSKVAELDALQKEYAQANPQRIAELKEEYVQKKGQSDEAYQRVLEEELMADEFANYFRTGNTTWDRVKNFFDEALTGLKMVFGQRTEILARVEREFGNVKKNLKKNEGVATVGTGEAAKVLSAKEFKNFTDMSTKLLGRLEGKTTVKKQFIQDLTNSPDIKQAERDLIRAVLDQEDAVVNVSEFAERVKAQLVPLKAQVYDNLATGVGTPQYEGVVLKDGLRGNVENYGERVYESPIKTSAGEIHNFDTDYYFAHSRYEDLMSDSYIPGEFAPAPGTKGTTRRIIEIQSDLMQKGNLKSVNEQVKGTIFKDGEGYRIAADPTDSLYKTVEEAKEAVTKLNSGKTDDFLKLSPYKNTFHERIIREEVQQAAKDGKTTLQFPTGETAMKIEGLGARNDWKHITRSTDPDDIDVGRFYVRGTVTPDSLKVGGEIQNAQGEWIVTEVGENGTFKAAPKRAYDNQLKNWEYVLETPDGKVLAKTDDMTALAKAKEANPDSVLAGRNPLNNQKEFIDKFSAGKEQEALDVLISRTAYKQTDDEIAEQFAESFDISGKVDTKNPIFRFYEKTMQKYLVKNYDAKVVTDAQGVTWVEMKVDPKMANTPVDAFKRVAADEAKPTPKPQRIKIDAEIKEIRKAVKDKEMNAEKIGELETRVGIAEEALANDPAKALSKYAGKDGLPEVTGEGSSIFSRTGDDLADQAGFSSSEEARDAYLKYVEQKDAVAELRDSMRAIKAERALANKASKVASTVSAERRSYVSFLQDQFQLSDAEIKKITFGRDLQRMGESEFKGFITKMEQRAVQVQNTKQAKNELMALLEDKHFEKVDNYRNVHKFPPISQMNEAQLRQYAEMLEDFTPGDEFLSERTLETISRTKLGNVSTMREVREQLWEELKENPEFKDVKLSDLEGMQASALDNWRYDTALAEKNPFYNLVVNRTQAEMMRGKASFLKIQTEVNRLTKLANASRNRGVVAKVKNAFVPRQSEVIDYLEASPAAKDAAREALTKEELDLANYMETYYSGALDHLITIQELRGSRYADAYFTHTKKQFLEKWSDDGFINAIKGMFDAQKDAAQVAKIIDQDTGKILAKNKFFKYTLRRTGEGEPSQNATKVFLDYVDQMERKKSLDRIIPEIDVYTQALAPKGLTKKGLELDRSLKTFVNKYLNNKKGRRENFGGLLEQGGKLDVALRIGNLFVSLKDLGGNVFASAATIVGESVMTYQGLGKVGLATAVKRRLWDTGAKRLVNANAAKILKEAEPFLGRNVWTELMEPNVALTDKALTGIFSPFSQSSVETNKLFLLGKITKEELASGKLSPARLAELRLEAGRWRDMGRDVKSVYGATSGGATMNKYKGWAIPIARTNIDNIKKLIKGLKGRSAKDTITSREFQETYRALEITAAVYLVGNYVLEDNNEDSFAGKLYSRIQLEASTIMGGIDPRTFVTVPRLVTFLEKLVDNMVTLASMERYKTSGKDYEYGDLKGLKFLQRQLTPRLFKQFDIDEEAVAKTNFKKKVFNKIIEMEPAEAAKAVADLSEEDWETYKSLRTSWRAANTRETRGALQAGEYKDAVEFVRSLPEAEQKRILNLLTDEEYAEFNKGKKGVPSPYQQEAVTQ